MFLLGFLRHSMCVSTILVLTRKGMVPSDFLRHSPCDSTILVLTHKGMDLPDLFVIRCVFRPFSLSRKAWSCQTFFVICLTTILALSRKVWSCQTFFVIRLFCLKFSVRLTKAELLLLLLGGGPLSILICPVGPTRYRLYFIRFGCCLPPSSRTWPLDPDILSDAGSTRSGDDLTRLNWDR